MAKDVIAEIKKGMEAKKLVIGTDKIMKELKRSKIIRIFISSNCPERVKKDISHYSKISGASIELLKIPNDELGVVCKKQYSISVAGLLK